MTKTEAYLTRATTGCSCCRNENELHGPYRTLELAKRQVESFERQPLLAEAVSFLCAMRRGEPRLAHREDAADLLPDSRARNAAVRLLGSDGGGFCDFSGAHPLRRVQRILPVIVS